MPYMAFMISAMRSEFFIEGKQMDDQENLVFDTNYELFKKNEIAFLQFKSKYLDYYSQE